MPPSETFMQTRGFLAALVLFAAATTSSPAALAQESSGEVLLRSAELSRFQAQVKVDQRALGLLLDDDLEYVHSNGVVDSKASFIESLVKGTRDYVATTANIESVRIFGNVAIIRGTAKITVNEGGKPLDLDLGYTDFWVWKDGRWQMTAWRSARMPPKTQ